MSPVLAPSLTMGLAMSLATALTMASGGCGKRPRDLGWEAVFVDEGDAADVAILRARVLRGGCASSDVVHQAEQPLTGAGAPVPVLGPGVYGFELSGRSEGCEVVTIGCAEAVLPFPDGHLITTVLPASLPPLVDGCTEGTCTAGRCEANPPTDAGPGDASMDAPVDAAVDAPVGCTSAEDRCADDVAVVCDTFSGSLVTTPCPLGCALAAPRCSQLVPSNVPASLLDPAAADFVVSVDLTLNTDACTAPGVATEVVAQVGARDLCVVSAGAFTVAPSAELTIEGSRPLVIAATGPVTIEGVIDAGARRTTPGPGGGNGGVDIGTAGGTGPFAGRGGAFVADFADGGGGGGGLCGTGGTGGRGGSANGGAGGGSYGADWALSPLQGGSGGGIGRGNTPDNWDNSGQGGAGGGAVQITSAVAITLRGSILVGGGGGSGGTIFGMGGTQINIAAGGGGGSGGAVLLEAPAVTLTTAGGVGATGGGGGGTAGGMPSTAGEAGGNGGLSRANGGNHGGTFKVADGSRGGAGAQSNGSNGGTNTEVDANGGGAGGGVGCTLIRNATGTLPTELGASNPNRAPAMRALAVDRD